VVSRNPIDVPWEPFTPMQAAELLRPLACPWWIAGGYAIEHAVGHRLRTHADIDVLILRRDHATVRELLGDWDVWAADPPGTLRPWARGESLPDSVHDVWSRPTPAAGWKLQLMLDEADGDDWISRRDPRIRRPVASLTAAAAQAIPFAAPEIVLFYKASAPRAKDIVDLEAVWPVLSPSQRSWLITAVLMAYGESSPWYGRLRAAE
jgi:hypothetical protein